MQSLKKQAWVLVYVLCRAPIVLLQHGALLQDVQVFLAKSMHNAQDIAALELRDAKEAFVIHISEQLSLWSSQFDSHAHTAIIQHLHSSAADLSLFWDLLSRPKFSKTVVLKCLVKLNPSVMEMLYETGLLAGARKALKTVSGRLCTVPDSVKWYYGSSSRKVKQRLNYEDGGWAVWMFLYACVPGRIPGHMFC